MTSDRLKERKIAVLATNGVEQVELEEPTKALRDAGATVELVSTQEGEIRAHQHLDPGDTFTVNRVVSEVDPAEYDALVLPGGVANPDFLRMDPHAVAFVGAFFAADRPVAAICHAPWTLVEADVVRGRRLTSFPSLQTDLRNAGAEWVDEEVVVDGHLITSRKPDDLEAFCRETVNMVAEVTAAA